MRCIVRYDAAQHPPLLQLSIFDAPHRRMHNAVIVKYREMLFKEISKFAELPIMHPVDVSILFVNPTSPDLGNLYLTFERAVDGGAMTRKNSVLDDDSLISKATISIYYPQGKKK